jgi:hypothetical protein
MLFFALKQRRDGRVIPRHAIHPGADCVHGELRVADGKDPVMQRLCRVARLVKPNEPTVDLLPPLKDATLLYVDHARFVITGFEQSLDRDYAQTWMLTLDSDSLHSMQPIGGSRGQ